MIDRHGWSGLLCIWSTHTSQHIKSTTLSNVIGSVAFVRQPAFLRVWVDSLTPGDIDVDDLQIPYW